MMNDDKGFTLNYSPEHKDEIQKIKEKYITTPKEKTDIAKLRELDKKVEYPGQIVSLILGVAGTLLLGGGMSLILEDISLVFGVILGIPGIAAISAAYPVYRAITVKRRKMFSSQVLELVEKISGETE